MYSVTPFGFWLISQPGLFLGLTYDLSVYVAPRMSKHYLKQCFIRYFNMQFSKNNVMRATLLSFTHSGDKGIRTLDPLLARQVLSQLSYTPMGIWQPPALPYRLQYSTIGRLGLNHRVRDENGCVPQAHRHQKFLDLPLWQINSNPTPTSSVSLERR